MTPEQEQALQAHIKAIAKILYDDTPPEQLTTLAGIEQVVRQQMQKHVMPSVGVFISKLSPAQPEAIDDRSKASAGELPITQAQAQTLAVRAHSQLSPYLESCCLRLSANVSYEHAAADLEHLTGIAVSKSVQQRLVHRQDFILPKVEQAVEELSVDGGNIRIRTALGEICRWKGYKAVCLHERETIAAVFGQNELMVEWVNGQPLAEVLTSLGDGHDGIWNNAPPTCARPAQTGGFRLVSPSP